jgi:hypothetical protein
VLGLMLERHDAEQVQTRNWFEGTLRWIAASPLASTAWSAALNTKAHRRRRGSS